MRLDKLTLDGWRNYQQQTLAFDQRCNVIYGENAQGKTNLLESVFYLSTGKSFRTARNQELIRFGADFTDLNCSLFSGGREQSAVVQLLIFRQRLCIAGPELAEGGIENFPSPGRPAF